jgi:hypothetical protein
MSTTQFAENVLVQIANKMGLEKKLTSYCHSNSYQECNSYNLCCKSVEITMKAIHSTEMFIRIQQTVFHYLGFELLDGSGYDAIMSQR